MFKKDYLLTLWLFCALFTISCNKEPLESERSSIPASLNSIDIAYDSALTNLALAVHQSLTDKLFCEALKKDIMSRPDGDYEVILKSFVKRNISLNKTALFAAISNNSSKGSGDGSQILENYPKLQISIPVHAEKWDGISRLWVLYLPSNYEEFKTKEVPAISPEGKITMFNVEKEPAFPVIVIGLNERSNANGDLKFAYNMLREKVPYNLLMLHPKSLEEGGFTSFSATPVTNAMAVSLDWTFTYPMDLEPYDHYFEIYRDDLQGSGFQKIGETNSWESFYYDSNVMYSSSYAYYVVCKVDINQTYYHDDYVAYYYSDADDAALPTITPFTHNFTVNCTGPSVMQLNWTIDNLSNWSNLQIWRYDNYNPVKVLVADLPLTTISYQDVLSNPNPAFGSLYRYFLRVSNVNTGQQQEYYCDEYLANRINSQWLNLSRIQFNSFDDMRRYESWLGGGPEVILSVFDVNDAGVAHKVVENQQVGGPASSGFDVNWSFWVWRYTDPKALTISLNEFDPGGSGTLELSLGLTAKTPKVLGMELSTTFGIKGTINFTSNDEYIGTAYLYYWNNADGRAVQCGPYCKATFLSSQD